MYHLATNVSATSAVLLEADHVFFPLSVSATPCTAADTSDAIGCAIDHISYAAYLCQVNRVLSHKKAKRSVSRERVGFA